MSKIPHSPEPILAAEADYLYIQASQIANAGNGLFTAIPFFKLIREQNKRLLEKGFQTNTFLAKQ